MRIELMAAAAALSILALTGCAASPSAEQGGEAAGGMGMGGAAETLAPGDVVAAKGDALVEAPSSSSAGVRVRRVIAPGEAWVVVRSLGSTGAVLGAVPVREGLTRDVVVPLSAADGADVRVALHIDRHRKGDLEFNPAAPLRRFDSRIFVEGAPVESLIPLTAYGAETVPNSVLFLVDDQIVTGGIVRVKYMISPEPSWISVNLVENGLPGRQVGLLPRPAGEYYEIDVPVSGIDGADELVVTLHADGGTVNKFEYDARDPLGSGDQPFKDSGVIVSHRIRIAGNRR